MRVFVVQMRRRGAKLPIAVVKAAAPTVGWLHIATMTWRPHWLPDRQPEPTTFASLTETFDVASKRLLPQLQQATVVHLRGHQFVIAGAEILSHRGHPIEFRQAWWCRADSPRQHTAMASVPHGEAPGQWPQQYAVADTDAVALDSVVDKAIDMTDLIVGCAQQRLPAAHVLAPERQQNLEWLQ